MTIDRSVKGVPMFKKVVLNDGFCYWVVVMPAAL